MSKTGKSNVGQLIDEVTVQDSENWMVFMQICDIVNSSAEGPKEAVKCIRKRFATKNPHVIKLSLLLLETLVKNCGMRFHVQIATKDFLHDFMKIIKAKNNPPMDLQMTVLGLLQTWALAFQRIPELGEIYRTYQELKNKNIEFPPHDPSQSAQIFAVVKSSAPSSEPNRSQALPSSKSNHQRRKHVNASDLSSELNTIHQNCQLFVDTMSAMTPGRSSHSDYELVEDLNTTCREMQKRIVHLLESSKDEALTVELLSINDELNSAFNRYDKFQGTTAPEHVGETDVKRSSVGKVTSGSTTTTAPGVAVVDDLIDLGDTSSQDVGSNLGFDVHKQFNDMSIEGRSAGNFPASSLAEGHGQSAAGFDREQDIVEMEKWIMENEGGYEPSSNSNLEFEQFLQARAQEAKTSSNKSSQPL